MMWLMAPLSQSQWDTWLYLLNSEEILRHLNAKTKLKSQQLGSLGSVQVPHCSWKGKEGTQVRLAALGKKQGSQGDLGRNARSWRVEVCTEPPHGCCCFPPEAAPVYLL